MAHFQVVKPEHVLKRAEEYVAVGKKNSAITAMFELLSNRRARTWSQDHEKLMFRYLELCMEVKNSRFAKEGLHQYRNIALSQAPSSLEKVIEFLLERAYKHTKQAAAECNLKTIMREVEDLENDVSPESILLDAVTADKTRERTEREILVPWLKFLWESFRTVLDLLRNQAKLEDLYHATAKKAFLFCEEYSRTTEFRRLCDLLRGHLNPKYQRYEQTIVNTPEAMGAHLETRFEQLRVASCLRLWHEGFRTIEDIHNIMSRPDLKFSSKLIGHYYEKLTELFLVSENYLFHAYAFKKYFLLSREKKKNLTKEAVETMAAGVVLAAISIPLQNSKAGRTVVEETAQKEKNRRMAQLLGFDINPKRSALLRDLQGHKIIDAALGEVRMIFHLLEKSSAPLELVEKMNPLLEFLRNHKTLSSYVKPIEQLLVIRLVSQLSSIFQTVKLDYIKDLLSDLALSYSEVETTLVKAVRARQVSTLSVSIDHAKNCIRFGENIFEEQASKDFVVDFARGLKSLSNVIDGNQEEKTCDAEIAKIAQNIRANVDSDHQILLERRELIEKRKEDFEKKEQQRTKHEQKQQLEMIEEKAQQEKLRIQQHLEEQEKKMEEKVKEAHKLFEIKQEMMNVGVDLRENDITKMSDKERERLINQTREKQNAKLKEEQKKLLVASRRLDAYVRAKRELQQPKIESICTRMVDKARVKAEAEWEASLASSEKRHHEAVKMKKRTVRMHYVRSEFEPPLLEIWEESLSREFEKRVELVRKQQCLQKLKRARDRLAKEREKARKEEEERQRVLEIEEQRKRDDEERKKREEERGGQPQNDYDDEGPGEAEEASNWRRGPAILRSAPAQDEPPRFRPAAPAAVMTQASTSNEEEPGPWRRSTAPKPPPAAEEAPRAWRPAPKGFAPPPVRSNSSTPFENSDSDLPSRAPPANRWRPSEEKTNSAPPPPSENAPWRPRGANSSNPPRNPWNKGPSSGPDSGRWR